MGLVIHSPELARQVTAIAEDAMRPERSYQPRLIVETADNKVKKRLQWRDIHAGAERVSEVEPETSPIQRGLLRALQALPIEEQL
jgi:putative cardiolipin synthase